MVTFCRKPLIFRGPLAKKMRPSSASHRCVLERYFQNRRNSKTKDDVVSPILLHLNKAHIYWIKRVFNVILEKITFINPELFVCHSHGRIQKKILFTTLPAFFGFQRSVRFRKSLKADPQPTTSAEGNYPHPVKRNAKLGAAARRALGWIWS